MAIKLTDKTNIIPPDANYEYGNIRNTAGATPGTPVNVQTYADFHQFFERLMDVAGVTHNGLPDNTTNGYQLFEALEKLAGAGAWVTGPTLVLTPNTGTVTPGTTMYNRYKIAGKTFTWEVNAAVQVASGSPTIITIPFPAAITVPGTSSSFYKTRIGWYNGNFMAVEIRTDRIAIFKQDFSAFANSMYQYNFSVSFEID